MKLHRSTIEIKTRKYFQYLNITDKVQDVIDESGIKNGIVFINSMHNTATVLIQEDDPTIHEDTKNIMEDLTPLEKEYKHSYEGKVNAASHIRNQILGNSNLTIPLKNGKLVLGTWQQIFFLELLEARNREVVVTVIGE